MLAMDKGGVMIRAVDWLAHFLYEPALLGRRSARVPDWRKPLHSIHLIPELWLERACSAYDRSLGVTD
ncbi:hypothetical protein [Streptomyces sp. SID8499]|uniref:hypothetical protein n=1 Tax=Streptomyces sp. SID8499 TaxID=2706106 RepID=UPI0013C79387|nr:hypothetical protein [Streptomyces sp. SID8499]NED31141.1 hypothetical protein [Streptomyces sp. SID8499]